MTSQNQDLTHQPQNRPSCSPCPESDPFPILRDCLFQEVFPEFMEAPLSGTVFSFHIQGVD